MSSQILGSTESLPIDELETYHKNPRRGDTETIAQSLRANGQFRPLVVNRGTHTGRPYEVLAGNHTLLAARTLDGTQDAFPRLDCYVIDVDDDHARRIVLADNKTSDLATYDHQALAQLLDELEDGITGTGYDEDDLADLAAEIEEHEYAAAAAAAADTETTNPTNTPTQNPTGLLGGNNITDRKEQYAERATRLIALTYTHPEYIWVVQQLDTYLKNHPTLEQTHPAALTHLLAQANNTTPPTTNQEEN